jgi:hypothetical protein
MVSEEVLGMRPVLANWSSALALAAQLASSLSLDFDFLEFCFFSFFLFLGFAGFVGGFDFALDIDFFEVSFDAFENDLGDGEGAVIIVEAFDDVPWGADVAGAHDGAFGGGNEVVVFFPVFPIGGLDAPSGEGIGLEFFEALFLGLFAEVHPEFDDEGAVVGLIFFEGGDAFEGFVEFGFGGALVDAVEDGLGIPGALEEGDAAVGGEVAPVSPELGAFEHFLGGFAVGAGGEPAGVHPSVEEVHGLAFPGAVDAAEEDDDGEGGGTDALLGGEEGLAHGGDLGVVFVLGDGAVEFGGAEHGYF